MVQNSTATVAATATGRRERNRLARHRAYLAAALRIATEEGLHAVTMQRLADELDCAVGTVYTYFPSKSALVAEVQREAIERLTASYLLLLPELDARLRDEPDQIVAALAHIVAIGRFWIDIGRTYPQETRLLQLLMSEPDRAMTDGDALRVVPAALRHLDLARDRFAVADQAGALRTDDPMARTITFAAALNGVLQVGRLGRLDPDLLDGERLAGSLLDDLLQGWGADLGALAAAHVHIDALRAHGPLARPIPEVAPR